MWAYLIILLVITSASVQDQAPRQPITEHYSVIISKTCTECPTYQDIGVIFPDNTLPISGKLIDGKREKPQTQYHYNYYNNFGGTYFWLDPPANIIERSKTITITNDVMPYKIAGVSVKMNDTNTITFGHQRFVDKRCDNAVIEVENWVMLLGDTLRYMEHDCDPKFTSINTKWIIQQERSFQDITTSYKYKLEKWIAETKIKCKTICKEY